ncbi:MAG: DUF1540 domain-containing protein [Clostridia bacterium]|nr:DUF1540 domain-containing protein [Clostridia bacterium]
MSNKNCKTKPDICCDVKNCVHHTTDSKCTADHIKVSNCNACSCSETSCATFKLKDSAASGH